MKALLIFLLAFPLLLLARPTEEECAERGHDFAPWYLQTQMYYIPEQAAHRCLTCGYWQNISGLLSTETDKTLWPIIEAQARHDIGASKAKDGYAHPDLCYSAPRVFSR